MKEKYQEVIVPKSEEDDDKEWWNLYM
jgi:hypothetical protein